MTAVYTPRDIRTRFGDTRPVRVLVACEYSGRVRDAFREQGAEALSVDFEPSEAGGPHYRGDVFDVLRARFQPKWDLVIAHPPCTYLTNSGVRWLYGGKGTTRDAVRWASMLEGAAFFAEMLAVDAPYVAVENPIMHSWGRDAVRDHYRRLTGADSEDVFIRTTVQPWQHGDGETKATVLWTKNLPPLIPSDIVDGRHPAVHLASPGPNRWKERSRTYPGIARAMAAQWAPYVAAGIAR